MDRGREKNIFFIMLSYKNKKLRKAIFTFCLIWIALGPAIPEIFPSIRRKILFIQDWRMFTDVGNGWCKVESNNKSKINLKKHQGYKSVFISEKECILFYKNLKAKYPNLIFSMNTMTEDGWLISN